jgi:hypothetical protein
MFGKGASYLQQVESHPARKVVLIPGNNAFDQHTTPTAERKTFSILLGSPETVVKVPNQTLMIDPNNMYGTFKTVGDIVEARWNVFDVVPELIGDYYLRVEQIHYVFHIKTNDSNPPYGIELDPCSEYGTSFTNADLHPTYDKWPLQHVHSLDAYIKYPTDTFDKMKIRATQTEGGQIQMGLEVVKYNDESFDIRWDNGIVQLPDVDVYFKGNDGVAHQWVDPKTAKARGNEVTISGFGGYPVVIWLQKTSNPNPGKSETLQLVAAGTEANGDTRVKAVYKIKEPFVATAPMMVDRVRDSMFMREFALRIATPQAFSSGDSYISVQTEILRVKMGLYPVGARYDMGSRK